MSNIPTQKASHDPPEDPFEPITTAFRGPVLRQYFKYQPSITDNHDEFSFGATHATKRRKAYDEMESETRNFDDVGSPTRSSHADSSASSRTAVRSDRSGSTLAGNNAEEQSPHGKLPGDKEDDMEVEETDVESDSGYEGGEESEEEESERSSHTLGQSEGSSQTLGRSEDEDRDAKSDRYEYGNEEMEEDESDDEGDLFAQSYEGGSRK